MREYAGELWQKTGFVFANEVGDHLSPSTVYHQFKRIAESIGLPDARLHNGCVKIGLNQEHPNSKGAPV